MNLKQVLDPKRLLALLLFAVENLGPLIAFLALSHFFGLKVAIAGTVVVVVLDTMRRLWLHIPFTRLGLVASVLTVGFGCIDLLATTPVMLRFESVITNLVMAGAFAAGARGKTSMLQEMVEKKRGRPFVDRPDLMRFFTLLTRMWAAYFLVKAAIYLWLGLILPLDRAVAIRSAFGTASLIVMIAISATQSRRLYFLCQRLGLLPPRPEPPAEEA